MSEPPDDARRETGPALRRGGRLRLLLMVVVVLASAAVGMFGALLLLGDRGLSRRGDDVKACVVGNSAPTCPPAGATSMDGLVEKTSKGGFTLRTMRNGSMGAAVRLHVRAPDRPYIDIAHAQTHAALGQPVRVYTLKIDGRDSVVYMEDAPLLG